MSDEQLVRAIAGHIDGWRSATFGWQADPDPVTYERNKAAAIEAHAAECLRRIRLTLCAEATRNPPFARGSWQHAVDDFLVDYMKTSQDFATPHDAVAWLVKITGDAALTCHGINANNAPEVK